MCSGRYWLSFHSIVGPLLLSLLACCRSLWSVHVLLKGLAESKEKVTKASVCICYTLSGVALTLQTPHDGFLVNVKRAGATDWFLWHAQKPFSRSYPHSFFPQAVKCVLYYIVQLRVYVCVWTVVGYEGNDAQFKPPLSGDVCLKTHSSVQIGVGLVCPQCRYGGCPKDGHITVVVAETLQSVNFKQVLELQILFQAKLII